MKLRLFLLYLLLGMNSSYAETPLNCVLKEIDPAPVEPEAAALALFGPKDYPIERTFPALKVVPGKIQRDGIAFKYWRTKTPANIPDFAFNYHYMNKEEVMLDLKERSGFGRIEIADPIVHRPEKMLSPYCRQAIHDFYQNGGNAKTYDFKNVTPKPSQLAKEFYGSVHAMAKDLGIDFLVTPKKWNAILAQANTDKVVTEKFFLDAQGRLYILTEAEAKIISTALSMENPIENHYSMAELMFHERPNQKVDLLELGLLKFQNSKLVGVFNYLGTHGIDFGKYFSRYGTPPDAH